MTLSRATALEMKKSGKELKEKRVTSLLEEGDNEHGSGDDLSEVGQCNIMCNEGYVIFLCVSRKCFRENIAKDSKVQIMPEPLFHS